jgi:hypothetical protein
MDGTQFRDPFFGVKHYRGIPADSYSAATTNGSWLDTELLLKIIGYLCDVSSVGDAGKLDLSFEMADDDPSSPGTPLTGSITDVPEGMIVLPNHTAALPTAEPTIGSLPAQITAANAVGAPLRVYIDSQYITGTTGLKRYVRPVGITSGTGPVKYFVHTFAPMPYAGI